MMSPSPRESDTLRFSAHADSDIGAVKRSTVRGHRGWLILATVLMHASAAAAQQSDADLAAAAQNPVAATYSLPFQNNIFGGAGPQHNAVGNVLNIQPVLPFTFGDWNVISRTIAPLIYVPGLVPGLPTTQVCRPARVRCSASAISTKPSTSHRRYRTG